MSQAVRKTLRQLRFYLVGGSQDVGDCVVVEGKALGSKDEHIFVEVNVS